MEYMEYAESIKSNEKEQEKRHKGISGLLRDDHAKSGGETLEALVGHGNCWMT